MNEPQYYFYDVHSFIITYSESEYARLAAVLDSTGEHWRLERKGRDTYILLTPTR